MINRLVALGLAGMASVFCGPALADRPLISASPIELQVYFPGWLGRPYDSNSPVEKQVAERTGISLHSIETEVDVAFREEVARIIRSGQLPDIIGGTELRGLFNKYGPQGAFVKLDELIPEHAPNLHRFFQDNPDLYRAAMSYDHHLYFIPFFPEGDLTKGYFIRQDWLDKLGLEIPQTAEEFYEVLHAFKTRDPNGNGKADEIPFFARDLIALLQIAPLWDARSSGSSEALDFYVQGNALVHGLVQPEFKDVIRNLAKWYREGLIDPAVLDEDMQSRTYALKNNLAGAMHDWFVSTSSFNDSLQDEIPGFRLIPIAPPASASGQRREEGRRRKIQPSGWAISYQNPYPIETLKYFDFWFGEEGRRLDSFGLEGVHYDLIDGKPVFKPEVLAADKPVIEQLRDAGAAMPRGVRQDFNYEWQSANEIAQAGMRLYRTGDYLFEAVYPSALNQEEQVAIDLYLAPVKAHIIKRVTGWIRGEGDVDAEWESYLRELNDIGFTDVLNAMNSARWRELYQK
ncbi:MAG: extracellular solute-binding protein [Pseudorhodobacter sp.]